jgi:glycosyltransferase involved in cell wall biosynthesis
MTLLKKFLPYYSLTWFITLTLWNTHLSNNDFMRIGCYIYVIRINFMNSLKVSVIMPIYNPMKYYMESIYSILNQTHSNFEFIIIAEFGINDDVYRQISNINDSRILLIKNEKKLGLIKSLNLGLSLADGKYVARMDCDDISRKDRFEKQLGLIEKSKGDMDVIAVGSNYFTINSEGKKTSYIKMPESPLCCNWFSLIEPPIAHPSVLFDKSVINHIGGYSEDCKYCEDYDLWNRLLKSNHHISNIQEPLIQLRKHEGNVSTIYEKELAHNSSIISSDIIYRILGMQISPELISKLKLRRNSVEDTIELIDLITELRINFIDKYPSTKKELLYINNYYINMYLKLLLYDLYSKNYKYEVKNIYKLIFLKNNFNLIQNFYLTMSNINKLLRIYINL